MLKRQNQALLHSVSAALVERGHPGIPPDILEKHASCHLSAFQNLSLQKKRAQFYESNAAYVRPCPVLLGRRWITNKQGTLEQKNVEAHIVPLQQSLESLLNMPEVIGWVENPHSSPDEYMKDACDGEYIKSHPLKKYLWWVLLVRILDLDHR